MNLFEVRSLSLETALVTITLILFAPTYKEKYDIVLSNRAKIASQLKHT